MSSRTRACARLCCACRAGDVPKPEVATFQRMLKRHAVKPLSAAYFEDMERNLAPAAAMGMTTVLIGAHALTSTADFVHHRAETLPPFLEAAQVQDSR